MRSAKLKRWTFVAVALLACATAHAQLLDPETQAFSFQAKLTGVPDGARELHITLYDAETGGNQVGDPIEAVADVQDGIVSQQLPIPDVGVFDEGQRLWAEVSVDNDPPLSPRIPLIAVPYAFRVHRVGSVELDDEIVLGSATSNGSLQLYDGQGSVTITLLGAGDPAVDVTGTVRMGGVIVDEPTEQGFVLTSDSWGRGTWQGLPAAQDGWSLTGNAGTDPLVNFLQRIIEAILFFHPAATEHR